MGCVWPMNIYDADIEGQVFMSQYFKYIFRFTISYEKKCLWQAILLKYFKKKIQRYVLATLFLYYYLENISFIYSFFPHWLRKYII